MLINDASITGSLIVNASASFQNISVAGNIIPDTTNVHNLGSSTKYFKEIYVSTGSINFVDGTGVIGTLNAGTITAIQSNTSSANSRLDSIESVSASLQTFTASVSATNTFTSSATARLNALESTSASVDTLNTTQSNRLGSLETISASNLSRISALETKSASVDTTNTTQNARLSALETTSASVDSLNTTQNTRLTNLENKTGSLATTGSNIFYGNQTISGTVYIQSDLIVQGSSSLQNITGSSVNIGTNTIVLNTANPAVRYGGISVIDSGSTGLPGSIVWDSTNNNWLYVNPSGSSYASAKFIAGPKSATLGAELGLITNYIQKAVGDDHISSSAIYDDGTTIGLKSNTEISGTFKVATYTSSFNGNVGIGTLTPAGKLEVWQSAGNRLVIDYVNIGNEPRISSLDASGNPQYLTLNSYDLKIKANGTEAFRITELGKIGIGTTNPATLTHIEGNDADVAVQLRIKNSNITNGNKYLAFIVGGTTGASVSGWANSGIIESAAGTSSNLVIGNYENGPIIFQTNGRSEKVRILGNGYVGIGTTNPGNLLDVYDGGIRVKKGTGSAFITIDKGSGVGASSQIYFVDQGTSKWDIGAFYMGAAGADDFSLYNRNTSLNALTVLYSTGAVGVGVTSPQSQFVVGKSGNNASVEINLNNAGYGRIFAYDRGAGSSVNLVLNDPGSNVGIGTTNPTQRLHVNGYLRTNGVSVYKTGGSIAGFIGHEQDWLGTGTSNDLILASEGTNNLKFFSNGTTDVRMIVTTTGNVGIGLTNPSYKLHINGTAYASTLQSSDVVNVGTSVRGGGVLHGNISSNITGNLGYVLLARLDVDSGWICRGTVICASWTCHNVTDVYIRKLYASTTVDTTVTGVSKGGGQDMAVVDVTYSGNRYVAFRFSGGNGEIDVNLTGFGLASYLNVVSSVTSVNSVLASY